MSESKSSGESVTSPSKFRTRIASSRLRLSGMNIIKQYEIKAKAYLRVLDKDVDVGFFFVGLFKSSCVTVCFPVDFRVEPDWRFLAGLSKIGLLMLRSMLSPGKR